MTPTQLKTLENRCRRTAKRRGYLLRKDRQRDPLGLDYGKWYVKAAAGGREFVFEDIHEVANWMDGQ